MLDLNCHFTDTVDALTVIASVTATAMATEHNCYGEGDWDGGCV